MGKPATLRILKRSLKRCLIEGLIDSYKVYAKDAAGNNIAQSVPFDHEVPDNNKPMFSVSTLIREVPENSPAGEEVGDPVTATDEDDDTLTYSLNGVDASSFAIGSSSGQITVGSGTVLDYEAKNEYSVSVTVSDTKEEATIRRHNWR